MKVRRSSVNPIIRPDMDARIGDNINGPSLIRVPDWVTNRLGRYYLYFAHHEGTYIRLAFADRLEGPWRVHGASALDMAETGFDDHIASPDVHVIPERNEIWMYYHGGWRRDPDKQVTQLAVSRDGLHFRTLPSILGGWYWRVFRWNGWFHALEMPGRFRRSRTGVGDFEEGPLLFTPDMRHSAVRVRDRALEVFYTNVGDSPEHILMSSIALKKDWTHWSASSPVAVMRPEEACEGAHFEAAPSERGAAPGTVNQLRDPCLFEEGGRTWLLYTVAGERGIAIAELSD